ncbi:HutD family protein [Streptomyces sp. ODS28]|uniref:HutD/Ves family protein n=1 Tax=Streptomyces sp. ODS28 TaxID=3136688 RepID=UPI0031EF131E
MPTPTPKPTVVRMAALAPRRWANGAGWTREIHREPEADAPELTAWRLSLADIEETGPFSSFPGLDRHLMLASEGPLRLTVEGTAHDLRHTQVLSFAGDAEVATSALEGRARALNLMVRGGTPGGLDVVRGDGRPSVPAGTVALVVLDGHVSYEGQRLERFDTVLTRAPHRADADIPPDLRALDLREATVARAHVGTPADSEAPALTP